MKCPQCGFEHCKAHGAKKIIPKYTPDGKKNGFEIESRKNKGYYCKKCNFFFPYHE